MNWTRFFFSGPRRRKQTQSYGQYAKARARRERFRAIYDAEHPASRKPAPETFQASLRYPDGTTWECEHQHRTRSAARACAEQHARSA